MSVEKGLRTITFAAGADLSAKQFHLLELATDGEVTAANAATDKIIGVLQNKPAAVARAASVAIGGITKIALSSTAAGTAVIPGSKLVANTAGKAILGTVAGPTQYVIGRSLTTTTTGTSAAAVNQIGSMILTYEGFGSTVA